MDITIEIKVIENIEINDRYPDAVIEMLEKRGYACERDKRGIMVYAQKLYGESTLELAVPLHTYYSDFTQRFQELVKAFARYEGIFESRALALIKDAMNYCKNCENYESGEGFQHWEEHTDCKNNDIDCMDNGYPRFKKKEGE